MHSWSIVAITFVALWAPLCAAQHYNITILHNPPFVNVTDPLNITGFSIDVWNTVVNTLNNELGYAITYDFAIAKSNMDFADALIFNETDVGISGFVPPDGLVGLVQESLPYRSSYLRAVATTSLESTGFETIGAIITNPFFLEFFCLLILFVIVMAHIVWLLERRENKQFRKRYFAGIGGSLYYTWVTVMTLGYGDYSPKTRYGKSATVIILIGSILIMNLLAGTVASVLVTLALSAPSVDTVNFARGRVAAVEATYSIDYLQSIDAEVIKVSDTFEGIRFVQNQSAAYFVSDQASLLYANSTVSNITLIGINLEPIYFTFLFDNEFNSSTIDDVNKALQILLYSSVYSNLNLLYFPEITILPSVNSGEFKVKWVPVIILLAIFGFYVLVVLTRWIAVIVVALMKGQPIPKANKHEDELSKRQDDTQVFSSGTTRRIPRDRTEYPD